MKKLTVTFHNFAKVPKNIYEAICGTFSKISMSAWKQKCLQRQIAKVSVRVIMQYDIYVDTKAGSASEGILQQVIMWGSFNMTYISAWKHNCYCIHTPIHPHMRTMQYDTYVCNEAGNAGVCILQHVIMWGSINDIYFSLKTQMLLYTYSNSSSHEYHAVWHLYL